MGLDFVRKAARSFKKGLDASRVKLATPDLFTATPERACRVIEADLTPRASIKEGDKLTVRLDGDQVFLTQGLSVIGIGRNVPHEVVGALKAGFNVACGMVETVHQGADVAEVSVW